MDFMQSISNMIWGALRAAQKAGHWIQNRYSSQVQASVNPYSTCFSHCAAWLLQNLAPESFRDDKLTPDDVTREINSEKYKQFTRDKLGAWVLSRYRGNLNQLWHVQERYINDKLAAAGSSIRVMFNQDTGVETVKSGLNSGPVIVNTSPVYKGEKLGHIMLIVGYMPDDDKWIIDDPFGDFRTGYTSGHIGKGDDLTVSVTKFEQIRGGMSIYAVS